MTYKQAAKELRIRAAIAEIKADEHEKLYKSAIEVFHGLSNTIKSNIDYIIHGNLPKLESV